MSLKIGTRRSGLIRPPTDGIIRASPGLSVGTTESVGKRSTSPSDEMLMKLGLSDWQHKSDQRRCCWPEVWASTLELFVFSIDAVGIPFHKAVINRRLIQGQGGAVFKWN